MNCQCPFVHFFQLIVFVNENVENKTLFVTQFVFYLMVLFVRVANKGKVYHGKTNRVFFTFSGLLHHIGSNWSYMNDLYLVITRGKEQKIFHRLGIPCTLQEVEQLFSAFVRRVFIAVSLYNTYAIIKLLIDILSSVFATFHILLSSRLRQQKIKQFYLFAFKYLRSVLDRWFHRMVLAKEPIYSKNLFCVTYHFLGLLILLCLRVILFKVGVK